MSVLLFRDVDYLLNFTRCISPACTSTISRVGWRWPVSPTLAAAHCVMRPHNSKNLHAYASSITNAPSSYISIVAKHYFSWSHSFTIENTECRSNSSSHSNHPQAFAAIDSQSTPPDSSSSSSEASSLTSSNTHSTLVANSSALGPQSKLSVPTASTVSADPLSTAILPKGFGLKSSSNSATNRFTKNGHWFDLEKAKFRLVFIVWPALVGISMAM